MPSGLGTAVIDFGATPSTEASVAVTGQSDITSACAVEAWVTARSTAGNDAEAHKQAAVFMRFVCSTPTDGVGFTITAYCLIGYATGEFEIDWTWSD
jgi:hypothetical protein